MKAIVSITLDNEFVVHDIKVIEGEGMFIAMPAEKLPTANRRDRTPDQLRDRDKIPQSIILAKYETTLLGSRRGRSIDHACIRHL